MKKVELTKDQLEIFIDVLDASIYNNKPMMSDNQVRTYKSTLSKLKQMKSNLNKS